MDFKSKNYWALILGASSGIGLASAKKLATTGLNIIAVHRDRRGAMAAANEEFDAIRELGVKVASFNVNALERDGMNSVIAGMTDVMAGGKVRLMLHSIALGNLKLLAPVRGEKPATVAELAAALGVVKDRLQDKVDELFDAGFHQLAELASAPRYDNEALLGDEDMAQTIYNMGTNLLTWVREVHGRNMFAADARILGLTSEGNEIAWRGYAAVAAAKSALESVARAIAVEYAPYGLRCNILQPGITDTPALRLIPGSAHMKAQASKRNPFGRITTPEDVANVVKLMASDEAAWINGTIVRVDGGEHIAG